MKIAIFSDSHGDAETMCGVVEKEKPDMVIYLGDGISDAEKLNEKYPDIKTISVLGGVDTNKEDEEWIKLVEIRGKRFVITHGHTFINYTFINELEGYQQTDENRIANRKNMLKIINENNTDILLHGHTHEPYIDRIQATSGKTCWIMNPGSIGRKNGGIYNPVYGMLKIAKSGTLEWQFIEVD